MKPEWVAMECVYLALVVGLVLSVGWFMLRLAVGAALFVGLVWRVVARLARRGAD